MTCKSCRSKDHTISRCPKLHFSIDRTEVIKKHLQQDKDFRQGFKRRYRTRVKPTAILEQVQEASSQIQIRQQPEFKIESVVDEEFQNEHASYSSIDEVLDRRVYDPAPLDYVEDTKFMRYLDIEENYYKPIASIGTLQFATPRRARPKVGEIEMFVKDNYDQYHHNLNLDRVRNFEVYFPNNNIIRMQIEFEKTRLENLVQMRLGLKAKHISPLLIKSFKMTERKNSLRINLSNMPSEQSLPKPQPPTKRGQKSPLKESEKKDPPGAAITLNSAGKRRNSANPSDILLYSTSTVASSQFKRISNDKFLRIEDRHSTERYSHRSFDLPVHSAAVAAKEKKLSMIKEDQSNFSLDSPSKQSSSRFKFHGTLGGENETLKRRKSSMMRKFKTSIDLYNPPEGNIEMMDYWNQNQAQVQVQTQNQAGHHIPRLDSDDMENSGITLRLEEFEGETPYSREEISSGVKKPKMEYIELMQKLTDKLAENSKSRNTMKTDVLDKEYNLMDRDESSRIELENSKQLEEMYQDRRLFDAVLQARETEMDALRKTRSTSEGRARDVQDFIKKNNIKEVLKKMNNDGESNPQSFTSTG